MPDALNLLENITPADLTAFARAVPVRQDFALSTRILPTRVIRNVKYRTRNRSVTVNAAKYRAFDAPTPFLRSSVRRSIREGYLPPLGGKEAIEEFEVILAEIARGADDQSLLDAVFDNVENQVLGIRARVEAAAGDLLTDGVIDIDENDVIYEADFGVPAEHLPVAATPWNVDGARPLTDELAWMQVLADAGQATAAEVVTSRRAATLLATNAEYRGAYWGETAGDGANRPNLTPEQVNSVRGTYGLPPITLYDVQVPIDGIMTRVLPEDRWLLLPADKASLGSTTYGLTAEGIILSSTTNPKIESTDAPGIISTSDTTDDPPSVTTKSTAVALPILDEPTAFVSAKVLG